ncbi:MAG: sulfotransferase [bacterium]
MKASKAMNNGLPNLIVIGAMKCGTSSLHQYLSLHPQICMSKIKEPAFFIKERNWVKGVEWYKSIFEYHAPIMGESSTSYTKDPTFKGVPERMFSIVPDAKLIYLVRDPLKRIVSHYIHMVVHYGEKRSIEEAICEDHINQYISYSKYYSQLVKFLEYYSLENLLLINFDDFVANTKDTMGKIFNFLNLDCQYDEKNYSKVHNQTIKKRIPNKLKLNLKNVRGFNRIEKIVPWAFGKKIVNINIDRKLKNQLREALDEDMKQLKKLTGFSFNGWD